jgi:hypothetical protein
MAGESRKEAAMTRSKLSTKVILLMAGIGLSAAAFAGSQPAAAQSYSDEYSCPVGSLYDPTYGCSLPDDAYQPYDYGDYGYLPYGAYYGGHREFGHGFGHGMGGGVNRGVGFAHGGGGEFAHGIGGGFGHGGGGGHR